MPHPHPRLHGSLALWLLLCGPAAAVPQGATVSAALAGSTLSGSTSDIVPKIHLSNLTSCGTTCVIDIIGDSTATDAPVAGYAVDPSQTVWDALKTVIRRKNPQITSLTFNNRGIPSANWSHPLLTGTATGLVLPSWFTTPGNTWLSYVQADAPDVLFVMLGTNAPSSGAVAGNSVATFIRTMEENIAGWSKKPNIVYVTNKVANPLAGGTYLSDQDNYKAMAAFERTYAQSCRKGYTSVSALPCPGLIDLGRAYVSRVEGYDPANQYLRSVPGAAASGITTYPYTVGTDTAGDMRLVLTLPAQGGTTLYNNGVRVFYVAASAFYGNRLAFTVGSGGGIAPSYQTDGVGGAPSQAGNSVPTTAGSDIVITITLRGEMVQVQINGTNAASATVALDTTAPRLVSRFSPTVSFSPAPTVAPTLAVTAFYEGVGSPTLQTLSTAQAYGVAGTTVAEGGNGLNHPQSETIAMDWQVIGAAALNAP